MKNLFVGLCAALLLSACGDSSVPLAPSSAVPSWQDPGDGVVTKPGRGLLIKQPGTMLALTPGECSGVTYVGPIRLPVSVHGTAFDISWLGSDDATRGYEWELQLYHVTNTWVDAQHGVETSPELHGSTRTHGTYRFRVRGLFCNGGIGLFTDYVVFSTDGEPDNAPQVAPPAPGNGGDNTPPPPPGDDDDDDDGENPPPPPQDEPPQDVTICHVEYHPGHGGNHPVPPSYTSETLTLPSPAAASHLLHHALDSLGACESD